MKPDGMDSMNERWRTPKVISLTDWIVQVWLDRIDSVNERGRTPKIPHGVFTGRPVGMKLDGMDSMNERWRTPKIIS
jgi:hypothetical protein